MKPPKTIIYIGLFAYGLLPTFGLAHNGEVHEHEAPAASTLAIPNNPANASRWELQSPDVELLGVIQDNRLSLYADHFASNEPLANAKIELEAKDKSLKLTTDANGIGQVAADWLAKPEHYDLTATVQAKGISDLLIGKITISAPTTPEPNNANPKPWWQFWGANFLNRLVTPASAHGGENHDHSESVPTLPTTTDKSTRLPDGSVYMPKAAQRFLGIRTIVAQAQTVPQSVILNATVINDPNASGQIQPTQSGRVSAPASGFPAIGTAVKKGQILAIIAPVTSNVDQADRAEKIAQVQSELALAEKNAQRLAKIAGIIPQMEVDAARNTADTLQARLKALQSIPPQTPETIVAPLSGLISQVNVTAGQQADAGQILFTILNPKRLQVEALSYDSSLLNNISKATATLNEHPLELRYVGSSQQLRNQALPLRFQVSQVPTDLTIGQVLKITVQTKQTLQGLVLPASSVVNDAQQNPIVWEHTHAEQFVPHRVSSQVLNANQVVITQGLSNKARIVTQGAVLLAQVR
jgi:hypothetical protein